MAQFHRCDKCKEEVKGYEYTRWVKGTIYEDGHKSWELCKKCSDAMTAIMKETTNATKQE